ncbi:MAG: hypothetical protein ACI80F_002812 [Natronomonas sp.]
MFAVVLGLATLALLVLFVREWAAEWGRADRTAG